MSNNPKGPTKTVILTIDQVEFLVDFLEQRRGVWGKVIDEVIEALGGHPVQPLLEQIRRVNHQARVWGDR